MIQIEEVSHGLGPRHQLRVVHRRRGRHLGVTSVQDLAGDVVGPWVAGQLADEGLVPRELLQRAARRPHSALPGTARPGGRCVLAGCGGHASGQEAVNRVAAGPGDAEAGRRREGEKARGAGRGGEGEEAGEEEVRV